MKRPMLILLSVIFLMGCGSITRSEFLKHDTLYQSWDHMAFSWYGYANPTAADVEKTVAQKWWGLDVPNIPGN